MRDKDKAKIKLIQKILKKEDRLIKNDLIDLLMVKGKMSRQTAINAIDMAVKSQQIIREEDVRGKLPIVWLSITPDIKKIEELLFKTIEPVITNFDEHFSTFTNRYASLSIDERADGLELFQYLFRCIVAILDLMMQSFKESKLWPDLMEHLKSKQEGFKKLTSTETKEDLNQISGHILGEHFLDMGEAFEDVLDYLMEISKKYP